MCLCRARPEPGFTGSTLGNVEACEIKPAKNPRIYIYMYTHVCEKRRARLLRAARPHGLVRTRAAAPPPSACPAPRRRGAIWGGRTSSVPLVPPVLAERSEQGRGPAPDVEWGLVKRWSRVPLSPGRSQSPAAESKALRARPWAASLQCQSRQRRVLVCGHSAARGLRRGRGLAGAAGPRRRPPGRRPGLLPMRRSGAGAACRRRQLRHLRRLRHPPRLPRPAGGLCFKLTDPVGGSWGGCPWRPGALCSLTVDEDSLRTRHGGLAL